MLSNFDRGMPDPNNIIFFLAEKTSLPSFGIPGKVVCFNWELPEDAQTTFW